MISWTEGTLRGAPPEGACQAILSEGIALFIACSKLLYLFCQPSVAIVLAVDT